MKISNLLTFLLLVKMSVQDWYVEQGTIINGPYTVPGGNIWIDAFLSIWNNVQTHFTGRLYTQGQLYVTTNKPMPSFELSTIDMENWGTVAFNASQIASAPIFTFTGVFYSEDGAKIFVIAERSLLPSVINTPDVSVETAYIIFYQDY